MVHPFKMKGFFIARQYPKYLKPNTGKHFTYTSVYWCVC